MIFIFFWVEREPGCTGKLMVGERNYGSVFLEIFILDVKDRGEEIEGKRGVETRLKEV